MELPIWKLQRYRILVLCGLGNIIGMHSEELMVSESEIQTTKRGCVTHRASFRWSFGPHSAWGSIEPTTILTTHPSLVQCAVPYNLYHSENSSSFGNRRNFWFAAWFLNWWREEWWKHKRRSLKKTWRRALGELLLYSTNKERKYALPNQISLFSAIS